MTVRLALRVAAATVDSEILVGELLRAASLARVSGSGSYPAGIAADTAASIRGGRVPGHGRSILACRPPAVAVSGKAFWRGPQNSRVFRDAPTVLDFHRY
jgi:hypothetical protein